MARDEGAWANRTASRARRVLPMLAANRGQRPDEPDLPSEPQPDQQPRDLDDVIGDCGVYEAGRRRPGGYRSGGRRSPGRPDGFVWIGLQQADPDEVAAVARAVRPPAAGRRGRGEGAPAAQARDLRRRAVPRAQAGALRRPRGGRRHRGDRDVRGPELRRHGAARRSDVLLRVRAELDHGVPEILERWAPPRCCTARPTSWSTATRRRSTSSTRTSTRSRPWCSQTACEDHSERIYKLKREMAEFRRAVLPLCHRPAAARRGRGRRRSDMATPYFRDVLRPRAARLRTPSKVTTGCCRTSCRRICPARRPARPRSPIRQSEIAVQQNEDMRKISAWAAIALVPTAIAGIYGMNFDNMPELKLEVRLFPRPRRHRGHVPRALPDIPAQRLAVATDRGIHRYTGSVAAVRTVVVSRTRVITLR